MTGQALLSLDERESIQVVAKKGLKVSALHFSPAFLNPMLNSEILHDEQKQQDWRTRYHLPSLNAFLFRKGVYTGLLPLDREQYAVLERYFQLIGKQIHQQPDFFGLVGPVAAYLLCWILPVS